MADRTIHAIDYKQIFTVLPEHYVVFKANPPSFTIVDANEAYCTVTGKTRRQLIGKNLFDVFPDTSPLAIQTGKGELARSLETCIATKAIDSMGVIRYDLKDEAGNFTVRYWQATHYPILDEAGSVDYIIQNTQDVTDMVLANDQLRLADLKLDDVLSAGMIGSWIWNVHDDVVIADRGLARLFDLDERSALKGMPLQTFIETIHEDDRPTVQAEIDAVLQEGIHYKTEYRTVDNKGRIKWVIASGQVERLADGSPQTFSGILIDITDRKQAEEALRDSESKLRFMADSMPQLVWITRPDGYHEYYNQRWYDYTGTTVGSVDGEGWRGLFHADDQPKAQKRWQHSLKTGDPYEIEYRLYHAKTKTYRWVIGRAMPYHDETGTIIKWYGTCTDIDEQKRNIERQKFLADASKLLTQSIDYRKTLKKVGDLCVKENADWCVIEMYNKDTGFEELSVARSGTQEPSQLESYRKYRTRSLDQPTGIPAVIRSGKPEFYPYIDNDMIEKSVEEKPARDYLKSLELSSIIIVPISIGKVVSGTVSLVTVRGSRYFNDADLAMAQELGTRISLAITNTSLFEESAGEIVRRRALEKELRTEKRTLESRVKERTKQLQLTNQGLREEIKKRHKVEEELKRYSKSLAISNQELQDFAYVASHDLQEPLRKIQAFGDLLETEYRDRLGDGVDYLQRMQAAASRMSILIKDLLAFSRVTSQPQQPSRINLSTVVADVLSDLESRVKDVGGTVKVGKLPMVSADETHMRQLFQNLISNALKFHRPDVPPLVEIASRQIDKNYTEITVADNGIGFDVKYLDRIFTVFQRLHGRDNYEGTGIGLAVCRKIVEKYGGTITADSRKNQGATFIIRLPKKPKEKQ